MKTIYKYPLKLDDEQTIKLPAYSKPLTVQVQHGIVTLWALVDDRNEAKEYHVRIHGTGNPATSADPKDYLGTVQLDGFVWHVFGGWF